MLFCNRINNVYLVKILPIDLYTFTNNMFVKKTLIMLFTLMAFPDAGEIIELHNLQIDIKQNGLFLTMDLTESIPLEHFTGWIKDDWFYMTILNARSDSIEFNSFPAAEPIVNLSNYNTEESTQIAMQLTQPLENFEFYLSEDERTIIVALYYPAESVLAMIDQKQIKVESTDQRLKNVLWFTGTALTISGIISGDGSPSGKIELFIGLLLLAGAYMGHLNE